MEKKKVLVWADTPNCSTGFGTVSRNVLKQIHATGKYSITIIGINFNGGYYDQQEYPYVMYPAASALTQDPKYKDVFGRTQFLDHCASGAYDIVYIIQDTFIVNTFMKSLKDIWTKLPQDKKFTTVYYFPIDGTPRPEWIKDVVAEMDFPVAYTKFGKNECLKIDPNLKDMPIIHHGVDKSVFYPILKEGKDAVRVSFFDGHKDDFIVLNVGRNQPRKDMHKTFAAFSIFHKKYPKSFLFILAQADDVGGNLIEIAKNYGLEWDKDWACPAPGTYGANQGYTVATVNNLYNVADLLVSTTLGEGYGLSAPEGMACKTPLLMPKNTSLIEIIGENEERGTFCASGKDLNGWICLGTGDNNIIRPTVDAYDMADKMEYIYLHKNEPIEKEKVERAFFEVKSWEDVGKEWVEVFSKAEAFLDATRSGLRQGRNEPCICGSGKKAKNCCKKT